MFIKDRSCVISDSSNIKWVEYDRTHHKLQVAFSNGGVYQYDDVPPRVFGELVSAESVGKHFASHVRPKYEGMLMS
jgi:hypothetical protein